MYESNETGRLTGTGVNDVQTAPIPSTPAFMRRGRRGAGSAPSRAAAYERELTMIEQANGDRGYCPKCAVFDPWDEVKFHKTKSRGYELSCPPGSVNVDIREHLHFTCKRCGYDAIQLTATEEEAA